MKGADNNVIPFKKRTNTNVRAQITSDGRKVIPFRSKSKKPKSDLDGRKTIPRSQQQQPQAIPEGKSPMAKLKRLRANNKKRRDLKRKAKQAKKDKRRILPPKGDPKREKAEQALRAAIDSWLKPALIAVVAVPMWLLAVLVMNIRSLASLKPLRETKIGVLRFSAKNIFDMFNPKKKQYFAFSAITGIMVTALIDGVLVIGIAVSIIVFLLPPVILSMGVGALFDPGIRALLLSFVGF